VKKLALAGNLHRMMSDIRAIGSRHRFNGNVGAPTLAIQEMAIGGS
ncbi:MAG: TldD/PmbA family protein, partial [Deltaproteobacteria bacterium]|nr:TldD/PmbA family protein [Deltaproteobacteria bacterium]